MNPEWAQRLNELLEGAGWSVVAYCDRVNSATEGPVISLAAIHKYLDGKVANPRGNTLERLAAPFGKSDVYLRHGFDLPNEAPKARIPLLTMNEVGTLDLVTNNANSLEGRTVVSVAEDDGEWIAVHVQDDSCAPKIDRGATVFCRLVDDGGFVEPGSLVLAKVEGVRDGVLRKYRAISDLSPVKKFDLLALNNDYPSYSSPERSITIIGVVGRVLNEYRP